MVILNDGNDNKYSKTLHFWKSVDVTYMAQHLVKLSIIDFVPLYIVDFFDSCSQGAFCLLGPRIQYVQVQRDCPFAIHLSDV